MATETLYATSHITGSCLTPNNALGAPNAVFTTNSGNSSWTSRWAIGDPVDPLSTANASVTVRMGKPSTGGGTPTVTITLYENGSSVAVLASGVSMPDSTSTDLGPYTFAQSLISNRNNVEIEIAVSGNGGGPNQRTANVDSITVAFDTATLTTVGTSVGSAWNVLTSVPKTQDSAWDIDGVVGTSFDSAWDVLSSAATETLYGSAIANNVSTITTGNNSIGAANDAWTTDSNRLWYALWDMQNPSGMLPETGTLNLRLRMSSGSGQTYDVWLYENDRMVEVIATNQSVANAATTYQHTINLGKIKDPTQIQIRMDTSTNWSEAVQIDALWIEFTPVTGKVRASFDTAWDVYGGATEVAVWDFFYPTRTPEPASVAPGWNVSALTAGPGMNSGLGVGATDYDPVYRNYFVGGAEPTSAFPTEPVARVASTSTTVVDALANDRYVEMTFSRTDNGAFTPAGLAIKTARGGSGTPRGMVVRGSHDAYNLDIDTMGNFSTVRPTWEQWNLDLSGVGEVTTLTLRFYIYTTGSTSTIAFDDIVLTATPSASTTTVGKTVDTAWDVDATVAKTQDSSWDVLATVTDSQATAWDVLTPVTDSVGSAWDVLSLVVDTQATAWDVLATVTDTVTSAWDALTSVSDSQDTAWDALTTVVDSQATAWNVETIGQVGTSMDTAWTVLEAVSDTAPTAWNVLTTVTDSTDSAWDVLTSVTDTTTTAWTVLESVPDAISTAWDVLTGVVSDPLDSAWDIRALVVDSVDSAWTVRSTVTDSLQSAWNVEAIGQVGTGFTSAWSIDEIVTGSTSTAWDVLTPVSDSMSTAWDVLTSVADTVTSAWGVLTSVVDTVDTSWDVLASVSNSQDTAWSIDMLVTQSTDTAWSTEFTLQVLRSTAWNVESITGVANGFQSAWTVREEVGLSVSSAWNLYETVSTGAQSAWDVLTGVLTQVGSSWAVREAVSGSQDTSWNVYMAVGGHAGSLVEFDTAWNADGRITLTLVARWGVDSNLLVDWPDPYVGLGVYSVRVGGQRMIARTYGRMETEVHRRMEARS